MQAIVARVWAASSACSSYRNRGALSWTSRNGRSRKIDFETYFVRPDCFRLDWVRQHPDPALAHVHQQFSIRSNGISTSYRWERKSATQDKIVEHKPATTLAMAIAAGAGISHGITVWIHQLLFPEHYPSAAIPLNRVDELLPQTARFESLDCYILRGNAGLLGDIELWADTMQFALRKTIVHGAGVSHEMHIHESVFDEPIEDAKFTA